MERTVSSPNAQGRAFSVHRSPFSVHRSPFTVHRSPFTVQRSTFSVQRSAFSGRSRAKPPKKSKPFAERQTFLPLWTCSESYSTIRITMSANGLNLVFSS
jgi:hypothetical protein